MRLKCGLLWWLVATTSASLFVPRLAAQEPVQLDIESQELTAGRKVFTEVGPGLRAMREDPDGRLYLLVSPQPGVLVYEANFKPVMQIGAALPMHAGVKTH